MDYEGMSEENYGVMISDDDSREYICDISDSYDDILTLVEKLNCHHIESCHIDSVIEDFKYKNSYKNT